MYAGVVMFYTCRAKLYTGRDTRGKKQLRGGENKILVEFSGEEGLEDKTLRYPTEKKISSDIKIILRNDSEYNIKKDKTSFVILKVQKRIKEYQIIKS